jgi:hypothetical protein
MSRSYKKYPHHGDYNRSYTKWAKRQAAKSVRRSVSFDTKGKLYRKLFSSYDIRDYIFVDFTSQSRWLHFKRK